MSNYEQKDDSYDYLTLALAIALTGAPWALGYSGDHAATIASSAFGVAIAACAIIALTEYTKQFEEVDIALGALCVAAPWIVGFAHNRNATLAHVAIGALVAVVSAGEVWWLRRRHPPHTHA